MPLASSETGVLWFQIPAIASGTLAPTVAEVAAGTEITDAIAAPPEGFTTESTFIEVPRLKRRVTGKIPGRVNIPDSAMTFYWGDADDDPERDVYALFPRDSSGFLARFMPVDGAPVGTPAAADICDVFPYTVASRSKSPDDFGQSLKFRVAFGITDAFGEDLAVLA
jgi:hypothetical protein